MIGRQIGSEILVLHNLLNQSFKQFEHAKFESLSDKSCGNRSKFDFESSGVDIGTEL